MSPSSEGPAFTPSIIICNTKHVVMDARQWLHGLSLSQRHSTCSLSTFIFVVFHHVVAVELSDKVSVRLGEQHCAMNLHSFLLRNLKFLCSKEVIVKEVKVQVCINVIKTTL